MDVYVYIVYPETNFWIHFFDVSPLHPTKQRWLPLSNFMKVDFFN